MNEIKKFLADIGRIGGKAGKGASKARSSVLARKAANARWITKVLHSNLSQTRTGKGVVRRASSSPKVLQLRVKSRKADLQVAKQGGKPQRKLEGRGNK